MVERFTLIGYRQACSEGERRDSLRRRTDKPWMTLVAILVWPFMYNYSLLRSLSWLVRR